MAAVRTGRRYDAEFMRRQLARAKGQGWSLVRLARESGISLPTLSRWRRRLEGVTPAPRFVEVVPAQTLQPERAAGGMRVEVELRGGHRVALSGAVDAATVDRLVALLARAC